MSERRGRKAKSTTEVTVAFKLPTPLVRDVEEFARENFHVTRAAAFEDLIRRGLEHAGER